MSAATIVRIAGRGEGVTGDGRHVPLAAPGDAIADDGAILPGPAHQPPPCRHFPGCGGCQLQHVTDDAYAAFVRDRIAGALAVQGIAAPPIAPVHLSPPRTRRRATLHAERVGRRVAIGFHGGATHRIVDMRECHVLAPALFALVEPLRALLAPLLPARRQATVSLALTETGVDVGLAGVSVEGLAGAEALTGFAEAHTLARLTIDEGYGAEARWEPRPATVRPGGVAVNYPPGGFLQATADGEAALVAAVRAATAGATRIADLFAGLGTFALPLAAAGARVLAVEGALAPAAALKAAAAGAGLALAVEHRDLFRRPLTTQELDRFDAVVLDPPRAGAKEQMAALAAARGVARIGYVSCNPATFARDARLLTEAGWRLAGIVPVGQFRWSTHVELAAAFER